tara:strand:- start:832 stop:1221 length:390 start_codon:yes stop_codon:yes gene_type:complete
MSGGLSFDWDDVSLDDEHVRSALKYLADEFGSTVVWLRESSSGNGLHIIIAEMTLSESGWPLLVPLPIESEDQMVWRHKLAEKPWELECRGRFVSDSLRQEAGLRTGRTFQVKNGSPSGPWKFVGEVLE